MARRARGRGSHGHCVDVNREDWHKAAYIHAHPMGEVFAEAAEATYVDQVPRARPG